MAGSGPWRLVTVNTAPERAKRLVGRVAEALTRNMTFSTSQIALVTSATQLNFTDGADFCKAINDVEAVLTEHQPNLLFCASMWTLEQSDEIRGIALSVIPGIKTYAIPQGLQVREGPDAIIAHLVEQVPKIIEGN